MLESSNKKEEDKRKKEQSQSGGIKESFQLSFKITGTQRRQKEPSVKTVRPFSKHTHSCSELKTAKRDLKCPRLINNKVLNSVQKGQDMKEWGR